MTQGAKPTRAALELVARASYGRLVALLARGQGDIATAEDALGAALISALEDWPVNGIPQNPEGWLLTTARRRALNVYRHHGVRDGAQVTLELLNTAPEEVRVLPDRRLELLFVCAHPAIDAGARTPLMLQSVLGLSAVRIAQAFQVPVPAMSQRLVRAKSRIRHAGIRFREVEEVDLRDRLPPVLDAVYAAFGQAWEQPEVSLVQEAVFLADLITTQLPDEPEAQGLLALMCHVEARRAARRVGGTFVPLDQQDVTLWSDKLIRRAELALTQAAKVGAPGRYQTEAAIQSVHAGRMHGTVDHAALVTLHEVLLHIAPSLGAQVSMAAALAQAGRVADALTQIDTIPANRAAGFQPYWAARAEILRRFNRDREAYDAYTTAIALAPDVAVKSYLTAQRNRLSVRLS